MGARLTAVHPVLLSTDVAATIAWYERVGFRCMFRDRDDAPHYAGIVRDAVELHVQWNDLAGIAPDADRPVYRFPVEDVDGLFAEFAAAGVVRPGMVPWDTAWGTREFHVQDPDRNGLQFYRLVDVKPGV